MSRLCKGYWNHLGRLRTRRPGVFNAGLPLNEYWFVLTDSIIYSFHMPLFFFLSGLFFYDSVIKHGTIGLIATKLETIVYPFIV